MKAPRNRIRRRSRPRLGALLAPAACALALVACAGDERLSSEEFSAEADSICTEGGRGNVEALADSVERTGEGDATVAYVRGLREAREIEIDQLAELSPPSGEADDFQQYLAKRRESVEALGTALSAAENQDRTSFDAAQAAAEDARAEADQMAAGLGLRPCANRLSDQGKQAVTEVIEMTATSDDPDLVCGELATSRFRDQFGGLQQCIRVQGDEPTATSVEVSELSGIDEVMARAFVKLKQRGGDVNVFVINLVFEDGWKVESIGPGPS